MKARLTFALGLGFLLVALLRGAALAQGDGPLAPWELPTAVPMSDPQCLACHAAPGLLAQFPDGSQLSLTVSEKQLLENIHTEKGIACV